MPDGAPSTLRSGLGVWRRLTERVRAQVESRVVPVHQMLDSTATLEQSSQALHTRLARLEGTLDRLDRTIRRPTGPFSGDMTMADVLRRHASATTVLAGHGLPDCTGCSVRFDETLAEAADAYGFDLGILLADLQSLLR